MRASWVFRFCKPQLSGIARIRQLLSGTLSLSASGTRGERPYTARNATYSNQRLPAGGIGLPPGRNKRGLLVNLGSNPNRNPRLSRLTS